MYLCVSRHNDISTNRLALCDVGLAFLIHVTMEKWSKIEGHSNYEISNTGLLKTYNWKNSKRIAIMKPALRGGYLRTVLVSDAGIYKSMCIHNLVANAFCVKKKSEIELEVNHKDGIKINNHADNLEWVTHLENARHAIKLGLVPILRGSQIGNSILKEHEVLLIRKNYIPNTRGYRIQMAAKYNVSIAAIKDLLSRRSWGHI